METQAVELISLKPDQLTPEERTRVDELVREIDISDSQAIIQYGVAAQKSISNFSDSVLEQIKAKDAGRARRGDSHGSHAGCQNAGCGIALGQERLF